MVIFEKNKYFDNKLAEEFDLIVLTNDEHISTGFPKGSLGTLTRSYTGKNRPLFALLTDCHGEKREEPLALTDFRVLNEKNSYDLSLIFQTFHRGLGN